MKNIICIIFLCVIHVSFSQTDTDYEKQVENITKFINAKDVKSIYDSFTDDFKKETAFDGFEKTILDYHEELGNIGATEFWMEGEQGNCYLLEFEKASMVLILKLTPELKISGFTIDEY
ncbi:hypothetical protein [uncultured Tenacibaculum sp.]|uniref:DUF3887 domain-containing protein n=1 Tax=uncultured Tenacibaculum sp. TaxID=174713 RepID=UPI0026305B1B|nr:hypothetical protein [uncultured Tenacibaculum sp.]